MDMRVLARLGAEVRIQELEAEIGAIRRGFPAPDRSPRRTTTNGHGGDLVAPAPGVKRRRKMSAAARKAISDAPKARWARQRSTAAADNQGRTASKKR